MSARRRFTTCQQLWKPVFVLLFVILASTGGVNNHAGIRFQRWPNFNCLTDKLPAVIPAGLCATSEELKYSSINNSSYN